MIIKTAKQLKDKVANLAHGDSQKSQILIRKYAMESFLRRVSFSEYKNHFILKGGMLVSALVGEDSRSTMDIDTTVKSIPLTIDSIKTVVSKIISLSNEDPLQYQIVSIETIMEEHDYSGLRIKLGVSLENLKDVITIDISTGDIITPSAVEFDYKMMFDDETIEIMTYNVETLLAEKIETILSRTILNTRMRDFYDVYILTNDNSVEIDDTLVRDALEETSQKRGTSYIFDNYDQVLEDIQNNESLANLWNRYQTNNDYVGNLSWDKVLGSVIDYIEYEMNMDQSFDITPF